MRLEGELRGCCGTIEPRHPLIHSVWHGAWSSAYADPRFHPVSAQELPRLEIAISVLAEILALKNGVALPAVMGVAEAKNRRAAPMQQPELQAAACC